MTPWEKDKGKTRKAISLFSIFYIKNINQWSP